MKIRGWIKITDTQERIRWDNEWFPFFIHPITNKKIPNYVSVTKTPGEWYQVWASSAQYGEIGAEHTKRAAIALAVKFMEQNPGGLVTPESIVIPYSPRRKTKKNKK